MKALMGSLAKKIKGDPDGYKALRKFVSGSSKDSDTITLSNGKKYKISTSPRESTTA